MSKTTKCSIALIVIMVFGYIVYSSTQLDRFSCEVCIEFRGKSDCRTALGNTEEAAIRTALDTACAQISSGMTDSIACTQTAPKSVNCKK